MKKEEGDASRLRYESVVKRATNLAAFTYASKASCMLIWGVCRSRVATFAVIRLRGPGFKPQPGEKFETRFLLHSHLSGGEDVPPVQGEVIRSRYIKPILSYPTLHNRLLLSKARSTTSWQLGIPANTPL